MSPKFRSTDLLKEDLPFNLLTTDLLKEDLSFKIWATDLLKEDLPPNLRTTDLLKEDLSSKILATDLLKEDLSPKFRATDLLKEDLSQESMPQAWLELILALPSLRFSTRLPLLDVEAIWSGRSEADGHPEVASGAGRSSEQTGYRPELRGKERTNVLSVQQAAVAGPGTLAGAA